MIVDGKLCVIFFYYFMLVLSLMEMVYLLFPIGINLR